VGMK